MCVCGSSLVVIKGSLPTCIYVYVVVVIAVGASSLYCGKTVA